MKNIPTRDNSAPILFSYITGWAEARNIIKGSDGFRQLAKLSEEMGELASAIAKQKTDLIADSIGDCVVVLTIIAAQNNLDMTDCICAAYNEIKDRSGRMIDGVFIKIDDLLYPQGGE